MGQTEVAGMPVLRLLLAAGSNMGEAVIQWQHMETQMHMGIFMFMISLRFVVMIVLCIDMDMRYIMTNFVR